MSLLQEMEKHGLADCEFNRNMIIQDRILDAFTAKHFETWIDRVIYEDERERVRGQILRLLEDQPDLLETHSWPELRNLAAASE